MFGQLFGPGPPCRAQAALPGASPALLRPSRATCVFQPACARGGALRQLARRKQLDEALPGGPIRVREARLVCRAGRQQRTQVKPGLRAGVKGRKGKAEEADERPKWDIFSLEAYNQPWQVPWGAREIAVGMSAWVASFLLTSLVTIPLLIQLTGTPIKDLSSLQKSEFVLFNQVLETGVGIGVLRWVVRGFEPPADVFRLSPSGPFRRPDGWLLWGILGATAAPFVVSATQRLFSSFGYTEAGPSTVDEVVKILSPDAATFWGLFAVTAVLAPILEEYVFRGFLLASLTKLMPVPAALLASSLAFGCAHLSARDLPELTALGCLLGASYLRSRNLLTPMLIHGLWNGTTLAVLFLLGTQQAS